jgi:hypothetical protein
MLQIDLVSTKASLASSSEPFQPLEVFVDRLWSIHSHRLILLVGQEKKRFFVMSTAGKSTHSNGIHSFCLEAIAFAMTALE